MSHKKTKTGVKHLKLFRHILTIFTAYYTWEKLERNWREAEEKLGTRVTALESLGEEKLGSRVTFHEIQGT